MPGVNQATHPASGGERGPGLLSCYIKRMEKLCYLPQLLSALLSPHDDRSPCVAMHTRARWKNAIMTLEIVINVMRESGDDMFLHRYCPLVASCSFRGQFSVMDVI